MNTTEGFRLAALAAGLVMASGMAHAADTYKFSVFETLGGSYSSGTALNKAGVVVGFASQPPDDGDPPMEPNRPVRWTSPAPTDLGTIEAGPYGYANGINDSGDIVGQSFLPDNDGTRATLWQGGTVVALGTLGGNASAANAINRDGVIVGSSRDRQGAHRAVVWRQGRIKALKDLGGRFHFALAISNNGYIAGRSNDGTETHHAVVWKDGVLTDLGAHHYVFGINSSGTAVGYAPARSQGVTTVEATMWNGTTPTYLGCLPNGFQCIANAINDNGTIVGESRIDDGNDNHAAMWVNGKVIDLNKKLAQATRDAGWVLVSAKAINSRGSITGVARNTLTGASRAFLLSR
jgi:probable HAF family extracellular repeat protein